MLTLWTPKTCNFTWVVYYFILFFFTFFADRFLIQFDFFFYVKFLSLSFCLSLSFSLSFSLFFYTCPCLQNWVCAYTVRVWLIKRIIPFSRNITTQWVSPPAQYSVLTSYDMSPCHDIPPHETEVAMWYHNQGCMSSGWNNSSGRHNSNSLGRDITPGWNLIR